MRPPNRQQPAPSAANQEPTYVKITIQDTKDFPEEIISELYTDISTFDNRLLFECDGLTKQSGIDFMSCPLNVALKLRVVRRLPQGPTAMWHVVLPLTLISKYLLQPPHEWETWLGLFPISQSLETYPPEVMFNQSVHMISRVEFPKLRLRFIYHNPELKAQLAAQLESQEEDSRRKMEVSQSIGQQKFKDLSMLRRGVRAEGPAATITNGASTMGGSSPSSDARFRDGIAGAVRGIDVLRQELSVLAQQSGLPMPAALGLDQVASNNGPGVLIEMHCHQLADVCQTLQTYASARHASDSQEMYIAEGIRLALQGSFGAGSEDGTKARQVASDFVGKDPKVEELALSIQTCRPLIWDTLGEVAAMARKQVALQNQVQAMAHQLERLQQGIGAQQIEESMPRHALRTSSHDSQACGTTSDSVNLSA